jgi:uncharacterized protein (DUF2235 family)
MHASNGAMTRNSKIHKQYSGTSGCYSSMPQMVEIAIMHGSGNALQKQTKTNVLLLLKILQNKPRQRKLTRISCSKFLK